MARLVGNHYWIACTSGARHKTAEAMRAITRRFSWLRLQRYIDGCAGVTASSALKPEGGR